MITHLNGNTYHLKFILNNYIDESSVFLTGQWSVSCLVMVYHLDSLANLLKQFK